MQGDTNQEITKTINEIRRREISRLETELAEYKMKANIEIESLKKKLLLTESENQRVIVQYQHQCENLKKQAQQLEEENECLKHKVELSEKSNVKLTKDMDKMRLNMVNLEEQLTILNRNNGTKHYDTNFDVIINDLKKNHAQEVAYLQDQYKNLMDQMKAKDNHCLILSNEFKQLQQAHYKTISENSHLINDLSKELNKTHKMNHTFQPSNSFENIIQLNNQLTQCAKQNQQLNNTIEKLTVENEKLRSDLNTKVVNLSLIKVDKPTEDSDMNKLKDNYQETLQQLQKQRDDVSKLTEILKIKDKSIAEKEKKEIAYHDCLNKIQFELNKHIQEKNQSSVHSNHDCETLRNTLEMQLEDTFCKLIRVEEDGVAIMKQIKNDEKLLSANIVDEYMYYHQVSMEKFTKEKDEEMKQLQNRIEEYIKEIDELKQMYVKLCSEKENSLNEKEKMKKNFDVLNSQFQTLDKQYALVIKEKEELAIELISVKKELNFLQDSSHKQMLEKKIEDLKNELKIQSRQKEMIDQFKIDLAQSKERVLATEQRLLAEYNLKVETYKEQLEKLKKLYNDKVEELRQSKETISKLTKSDILTSEKCSDSENIIKSKLTDYENSFVNMERKYKLTINEITYKYKNEIHELELHYNKIISAEKILWTKKIEELKNDHKSEIDSLRSMIKTNPIDDNEDLNNINNQHQKQLEKAKEMLSFKTNEINELKIKLEEAKSNITKKTIDIENYNGILLSNSKDLDCMRKQIEEERSKFAQIMTNWAHEMHEMKEKLATTVSESEKWRQKYSKVKHIALKYKHANLKQQHIYNELLEDIRQFVDQLKIKTDELLMHRENEIKISLKDFENECKQKRLAFNNTNSPDLNTK
ncbi:putative leucine-rich repeat-containing protein DDB_G0290503 isoform X2 [Daktulosphaira vitifoliae]|nr:putative leucine-rich repeat-containing protein DDB_G0290503 isoform X2 [Daktulosphaira vitifoliae]